MSKKRIPSKKDKSLTDYLIDCNTWPQEWMIIEEDRGIGIHLIALFTPFIEALIASDLSARTIKNHMGNLAMLGAEIISRLNDDDDDEKFRKLKPKNLLLTYIDAEEGPLLCHLDPNNSADEARLKSFDNTCGKLCRFILGSK